MKGRGLPGECKGVGVKYWLNERECRGMPGERTRVEAVLGERRGMQGNEGEYSGTQGNAKGTYGSGKCQGNAGECRVMPGERMGVGANCQGNAGECQGNVW